MHTPSRARHLLGRMLLALPLLASGTAMLAPGLTGGVAQAAVASGRWAGSDIDFSVKNGRMQKVSVTAVHTCQFVGTGEFENEIQTFRPPGSFRIAPDGNVSGQKLRAEDSGYFDIRFAIKGRFVGGRLRSVVQTAYKYYDYGKYSSPTAVHCFSEKLFKAKRKG